MKRKVAIYARVSTEHEAQISALENQVQYYDEILNSNLAPKYTGKSRIITTTNTYASFMDMNTKGYKKLSVTISQYSNLSNVLVRVPDAESLYTKNSTGSFELDISNYDAIRITATAISGTAGTAVFSYTIE